MEKNHSELLIKVLEKVLEQLAFMFAEAVEKGELVGERERYLYATMTFKGHTSGTIGIAITEETGKALANNILGIEEGEEVGEDKSIDALKEFINIVCGQLMTKVFGEGPVFNLSVPEARKLTTEKWEELKARPETVGMMVEEMPMLAHVSF